MTKPLLDAKPFKNSFEEKYNAPVTKTSSEPKDLSDQNSAITKSSFETPPKEDSPKTSFGSDDFEFIQDEKTGADPKAEMKLKTTEGTFVGSFQDEDEIFRKLCHRDKFKENAECTVCNAKFGVFTSRKHCKFCGYSVCNADAKKTRPDPTKENSTEYFRICEICNTKYINRIIQDEFLEQFNIIADKLARVEVEMQKEQKKCKEQHNIADELTNDRARQGSEYTYGIKMITQEIGETRERIKVLDKENISLNDQFKEKQKQLSEIDKRSEETLKDIEMRQDVVKRLNTTSVDLEKKGSGS